MGSGGGPATPPQPQNAPGGAGLRAGPSRVSLPTAPDPTESQPAVRSSIRAIRRVVRVISNGGCVSEHEGMIAGDGGPRRAGTETGPCRHGGGGWGVMRR